MIRKTKRKQILDTATKLFAERGFEKTTTRSICKAIGMTNAGMYYYFRGKESLLFEILDDILTDGLQRVQEIAGSERNLKEKLIAIIDNYIQHYIVEIDKMKVFIHEQKPLKLAHKKEIIMKQREYLDIFVDILEALKKKGEIVPIDTKTCAFTFFGMVHWAYRWYNPKGRIKPKQFSKIISRIFTRGIYLNYFAP